MITDTDNDPPNFLKFSGSGGIGTYDHRVTSPLLLVPSGPLVIASVGYHH